MPARPAARTSLVTALVVVLGHLALTTPAAEAAPTLRVQRSYGAGPVAVPATRKRVLVGFAGKRGDVVTLGVSGKRAGTKVVLRQGARKVKATWGTFWKLPRTGRFTFVFTQTRSAAAQRKLQLQKVRVRPIAVDGTRKAQKPRRGFLDAVSFRAARGQRVLLSSSTWQATVLASNGTATQARGAGRLQLEAGQPIRTVAGFRGRPLTAGQTLVLLPDASGRIALTRSIRATAGVDGNPRSIDPADDLPREWVFDVTAGERQVIRLERPDSPATATSYVNAAGDHQNLAHGLPLMWVRSTGTQQLSVITTSSAPTTFSLSDVPVIGDLPSDGSSETMVTPEPGSWLVARTDGHATQLSASGPSFTDASGAPSTDWTVVTTTLDPAYCDLENHPPLGCGDYFPMSVDSTALQTQGTWGSGDAVVLRVGPGVRGMVTVRLGP